MSESKGFLALQLFAILSKETSGFGPIAGFRAEHLKYWLDVEVRGNLFAAGPLLPEEAGSAFQGGDLIIVRASSLQEAIRIAEDDPMHRNGARGFQVVPWLLNHFTPTATTDPSH